MYTITAKSGWFLFFGFPYFKDVISLIFYDGTYRLCRKRCDTVRCTGIKNFDKYACAWRIRIIDFSLSQPEFKHLRPYAVVAVQTGEPFFKVSCAESIGKNICKDFNLDPCRVLWIEFLKNKIDNCLVATFKQKSNFGPEIYYYVNWRPAAPNEIAAIRPFISEAVF